MTSPAKAREVSIARGTGAGCGCVLFEARKTQPAAPAAIKKQTNAGLFKRGAHFFFCFRPAPTRTSPHQMPSKKKTVAPTPHAVVRKASTASKAAAAAKVAPPKSKKAAAAGAAAAAAELELALGGGGGPSTSGDGGPPSRVVYIG